MSEIAIHVENLGKRYRLGQRELYKTLRDTLVRMVCRSSISHIGWYEP